MPQDYDGDNPIHYCTCGCGRPIGDGDWASGRRKHRTHTMPEGHTPAIPWLSARR